jgi:hypothetical protein
MKEVSGLNEIRLTVRAMCRTAQLVMPWNMAYNGMEGFLHNSNYAFAEFNRRSNRAAILNDFVNYILGLNAAAWVQKEDFLTSGEIKTIWGEWFGSRPASLLAVTNNDSAPTKHGGSSQGVAGANSSGGASGRGRGRGCGCPRQNQSATTSGQFSAPPPPVASSGQGCTVGGGSSGQMLCRASTTAIVQTHHRPARCLPVPGCTTAAMPC